MLIEIGDILKSLGAHKEISFEENMHFDYIDFVGPVKGYVKITNIGGRIFAEGRVSAKVELNCCRCCENFKFSVEANLREEFLDGKSDQVRSMSDDDLEDLQGFIYNDDTIDLREAIRQNILTALPINPVCNEKCMGICVICGKNKNIEKCDCSNKG